MYKTKLIIFAFLIISSSVFGKTIPLQIETLNSGSKQMFAKQEFWGTIWSYRIVTQFPDKTSEELYNEASKTFWKKVYAMKDVDAYLASWNGWSTMNREEKGSYADIQLVLTGLTPEAQAEVDAYVKSFRGKKLFNQYIVFRPVNAVAVSTNLKFSRATRPILDSTQWLMFESMEEGSRWFNRLDASLKNMDRASFLSTLGEKFSREKVKEAAELWDLAAYIAVDGDIVFLTTHDRIKGHEVSFSAFEASNY